jgi:hypothetical protein
MNRRALFSSLLGLPVLPLASVTVTPTRPLSAVSPHCPLCGMAALFKRRSRYVGDLVPVECYCGWHGQSEVAK